MAAEGSVGNGTKVADAALNSSASHHAEHSWDHNVAVSERTYD